MIVRLSREAEGDLERIGDYIARDNPIRAVSFVRELRQRCDHLTDMTEAFPLLRHQQSGVRWRVHGN